MTERIDLPAGKNRGLTPQRATFAVLAMLVVSPPAAMADANREAYGRHLARECTSCHRIDGVNNGIPSIVGWSPEAFVATMKFYREGARTNPVMVSVAGSLTDEQLEALAAYFGSLAKQSKTGAPATDRNAKK